MFISNKFIHYQSQFYQRLQILFMCSQSRISNGPCKRTFNCNVKIQIQDKILMRVGKVVPVSWSDANVRLSHGRARVPSCIIPHTRTPIIRCLHLARASSTMHRSKRLSGAFFYLAETVRQIRIAFARVLYA